jgi:serine/threonine protein kinase
MQRSQQPRPEPPRIAGYRDLVRVAAGGFSTVYTAYQETLSRTVALKVLHADGQDQAARQRFLHECELTGRLTGRAHIITVFAAGTTQDGRFFIAMQYLPKGSLAERVATTGPLPAAEVIRIGAAIAGALATAHAAGILHRDIKPGNILVSDQDEPVLSDFGIASLVNPVGDAKGVDAFTRGHTAPEVLDGQSPSAQSDLYAVGSTLYTLLTGVPPVAGAEAVTEAVGPNRSPAGLAALLRRTLAADPRQRPASAAELAAELAALLPDQPAPAPSVPTPPAPVATQSTGVATASQPVIEEPTRLRASRMLEKGFAGTERPRRKKMMIGAVVVAVVALVIAGSAFASTIGRTHDSTPAAAQAPASGRTESPASSTVGTAGSPTHAAAGRAGSGGGATKSPTSAPGQSQSAKPPTAKPSTTKPATPPPTACTTSGCAGKAYYVTAGDHLMVCDEKADGLGVLAQYTRTDVPLQNNDAAAAGGAGTCLDHNMNMAPGVKITFRVCLTDSSNKLSSCSAYITTSAS